MVGRVERPNRATSKIYAAMDIEGDTLFVVIISEFVTERTPMTSTISSPNK